MSKILIIKGADFSANAVDFVPINGPIISISDVGRVTIEDSEATAIYYTTDGSTPTTSSTQYSSAFTVTNGTTVKAISVYTGGATSNVVAKTYNGPTIPVSVYKNRNGVYTDNTTGKCMANAAQKGNLYIVSAGDIIRMTLLKNGSGTPISFFRYGIYANEPTVGATSFQYEQISDEDEDYIRNEYVERTVSENGYLLISGYNGVVSGQTLDPLAEGGMTVLKAV